jgi:hypothetical protein
MRLLLVSNHNILCRLKNTEVGEAVLKKIMEQEERDIKEQIITPYGMNIIATKL